MQFYRIHMKLAFHYLSLNQKASQIILHVKYFSVTGKKVKSFTICKPLITVIVNLLQLQKKDLEHSQNFSKLRLWQLPWAWYPLCNKDHLDHSQKNVRALMLSLQNKDQNFPLVLLLWKMKDSCYPYHLTIWVFTFSCYVLMALRSLLHGENRTLSSSSAK